MLFNDCFLEVGILEMILSESGYPGFQDLQDVVG
jgi:hypothetical protein